ncbi:unnamed protein product, partial [Ectocarpus sp. 8 AP-2014]
MCIENWLPRTTYTVPVKRSAVTPLMHAFHSRCIGAGVQCIYIKRKSTHPQYQRKQQLR